MKTTLNINPERKVLWKLEYFWGKRERIKRPLQNVNPARKAFCKLEYFWGKRDRIKWLPPNINPKRKAFLKTLIFWENMTFFNEHAWYILGNRVWHTYLPIWIAICFGLSNPIWICFYRSGLNSRDLTRIAGRLLLLLHLE